MRIRALSLVPLLALAAPAALPAQSAPAAEDPPVPQTYDWHQEAIPATTPWGQPVDTAATRWILRWTTMPEYTNRMVDHLVDHPGVVSPADHFGQPIGRPGHLHKVAEIHGYFEALARTSPRVRFQPLGTTEEGGELALVQVGSEENLARLEEVKRGMNALADPRATPESAAARLVSELPVIYTLYAGLHSTETGPPEMVMELAYRLAVSDAPMIREIRANTVVFIVPVAEPDGRDRVVEWHRRYNADVYDLEDRTPGPPYWGTYIFHDNNRDGLQLSARLTQILVDLFLEWKYPVGHDLHESVPYLYVSTGTGPYNRTVDPITISEWQWLSNYEVTSLTALGMPGVWTHDFYDGWYPGYLLWVTNTRNAVGRFYETFGSSVPNTMERTVGEGRTSVEWFRANPPRDTTFWSLRNNTNYMQSGVLKALELVSRNREQLLEQFWTKSKNSLEKGETEPPYGYVIPAGQPRRSNAAYMLNLLRRQGIEVHRATRSGNFGEVEVERGDYVVRMDQPYRNFVLTLMEEQNFPEDAPTPYDDVAWTFPLMFGVETSASDDRAIQELAMELVTDSIALAADARLERADWYLIQPHASRELLSGFFDRPGGVVVHSLEDSLRIGGRWVPPGAWLIQGSNTSSEEVAGWAAAHGFQATGVSGGAVRNAARHPVEEPRIAILHSWRYTQDDGWVRYAFDDLGIPYTYLGEDQLAGTDLGARFEVILFPSQGRGSEGRDIFTGIDPRHGPLPYTRTPEYPTHGYPDATQDMTGGMDYEGLVALRDFVEQGGTLITLGSATTLPVEFGLARGVSLAEPEGLFVPGSIVRGDSANTANPVLYGYPADSIPLFHQFGPYLSVDDRLEETVVLRYAAADSLFLSGLAREPEGLAGEPALVILPVGEGHLVLFGFDPLHRYQTHGMFALVWNAILHWNRLGLGLELEDDELLGRTVNAHF